MKKTSSLLLPFLLIASIATAQTKINITNVQAKDGEHSLQGTDATIQLNGAEGSGNAVILQSGDVMVKTGARVSTQNVRRSSLKDSAVNLVMEIAMKVGREKDSKRVEKIFYLDQKRTGTITQKFTFKQGINVRTITLTFNVEVE
jgi:hypothetical protein